MDMQAPVSSAPAGNQKTMAIIALVLGILSFCGLGAIPCCGFILPVVAIVLGVMGMKTDEQNVKTMAIVGIVGGALGIVGNIIWSIVIAVNNQAIAGLFGGY